MAEPFHMYKLFLLRNMLYVLPQVLISFNIISISDDMHIFFFISWLYCPFSVFELPSDIYLECSSAAATTTNINILYICQWDYYLILENW